MTTPLTAYHSSMIRFSMAGKLRKNRGKWYIDLWWQGRRLSIYSDNQGYPFGTSQAHADRMLAHIRYEIDNSLFDPKNYTKKDLRELWFVTYAEKWYARQITRGRWAKGSQVQFGYMLRNHLIPFFGNKSIRDIRAAHIEDFLISLKVAPKTQQNILGLLHNIIKDAFIREDIKRIPPFPTISVPDPKIKWIDKEQQHRILEQVKHPTYRTLFLFLMKQGCRPNEARALRWGNINWKREQVEISAAMDHGEYRDSTKEGDVRILPLHPEVVEALRKIPRHISGYVFTTTGKPINDVWLRKVWRKAATAVGIDISLYQGTKHSAATQAVNAGTRLEVVQAMLGHKDAKSTKKYAKLVTNTLKDFWDED
jgi:integrase